MHDFLKRIEYEKNNFTIDTKNIANTKVFKYLGITINCKNCTFTQTMIYLSIMASKGIFSLFSKIPIKLAPVKTMLNLFDTCIIPILLYGSEGWAPFMDYHWVKWDKTQTEKIHIQFLKTLLGVNRSTTNLFISFHSFHFSLFNVGYTIKYK